MSGKPVLSLEVDWEAAGLATGLMVEPCAVLAELRHTHSLLLLQPQKPSQALQLHCWVPVSLSYTQHAIIQLPQWSHRGKEETQVKYRSHQWGSSGMKNSNSSSTNQSYKPNERKLPLILAGICLCWTYSIWPTAVHFISVWLQKLSTGPTGLD